MTQDTMIRDAIEKRFTPDLYNLRQQAEQYNPQPQTQTYTVQAGDTLSQIAQRYGTTVGDITGYRSGNPDLIYPGEQLTIGGGMTPTQPAAQPATQPLTPQAPQYEPMEEPHIETWRSQADEYDRMVQDIFDRMKNMETSRFKEEYESREMAYKREQIDMIDTEIADLRAQRDENILQVKRNPNVSAAVMSGEVAKLTDFYNAQINNKINERNSIGEQYNSELQTINETVRREMADIEREMYYYSGLAEQARQSIQSYQDALRQAMLDDRQQDQFDQRLALDYTRLAQGVGGASPVNLQIITDRFTGEPIGVFNPRTGEISNPIGEMQGLGESTGSVMTQAQMAEVQRGVAAMISSGMSKDEAIARVRSLYLDPQVEAAYIREIENQYPGAIRSFFSGLKEKVWR